MDVDWLDGFLVGLLLLGALVYVAAPPEPSYGLDVSESPAPEQTDVRDFDTLEADAQAEFRAALDDSTGPMYDPPALERGYVRYQGTVYDVSVYVSESSLYSLLMPPLGILVAGIGGLGLVGRRLRRDRR